MVFAVTTLTLAFVKWRHERRANALASLSTRGSVAPGLQQTAPGELAARKAASAGLAASTPLGEGKVAAEGPHMLHQDPARTHRAAGRAPRTPTERWRITLGGPVVAQVVMSHDEKTAYAVSLEGSLSAIDRSGQVRWRVNLGDRAYATPFVANDGTIFAGSDAKKLVAITPAGTIAWKLDVDGELDTAPVPLPKLPGDSSERIAFAAGPTLTIVTTRGEVRGRFRAKKKIFTSPAASADGTLYFGSQDKRAYALRADGTLRWATELGADVEGGPAISDEGAIVFGTDGGRIVKLDAERGMVLWSTDVGGFVRGALSIGRDGNVLAGVYGPTPGVVRLSGKDGAVVGAFRIGGTGSRDFGVHGGPLEDDEGTLVFGAEDDRLYGIERSGKLRFALDRGADIDAPVTLTRDGALIVGADDGTVAELGD